ncbi:hypothetical protein FBY22_4026 [Streptomyces sp. SLBN-31]|nr:hypothetical protein FBY22_4026 [Streptomyces sp. SLBN-31]
MGKLLVGNAPLRGRAGLDDAAKCGPCHPGSDSH